MLTYSRGLPINRNGFSNRGLQRQNLLKFDLRAGLTAAFLCRYHRWLMASPQETYAETPAYCGNRTVLLDVHLTRRRPPSDHQRDS